VDYATAKGLPEGAVPKIIRICTEEIDRRGLESEGIYRARLQYVLHLSDLPITLGLWTSCRGSICAHSYDNF